MVNGSIGTRVRSAIACEQALLFGRARRVLRERASERRSREGAEERTPRSRVLARLTQIGELARRLGLRIQPIHLAAWLAPRNVRSGGPDDYLRTSLQCRRILGGQNLVRVRIILAAIFDFMTVEDWGE